MTLSLCKIRWTHPNISVELIKLCNKVAMQIQFTELMPQKPRQTSPQMTALDLTAL